MLPEEKHIVRIQPSGRMSAYIKYALRLLHDEEHGGLVQLFATGPTISKAISVAEILKRTFPHTLHQHTCVHPVPLPAGQHAGKNVNRVASKTFLSAITIRLATTAEGLQPHHTAEEAAL